MAPSNVRLKLLVDKKENKVIFAEAGKDFVDFLLYLLALPLATVIRLLAEHGTVGCLGNLYDSVVELDDTYMKTSQTKQSVLEPTASVSAHEVPRLLPAETSLIYGTVRIVKNYEYCKSESCSCKYYSPASFPYKPNANMIRTEPAEKGFVKGSVTYMVMYNLEVTPRSAITGISLFTRFNVQELISVEERVFYLGMPQALKLLKESLQSQTVLTSVFLSTNKRKS